jgi:acylpyruvate hydrolase
MKLVTVGLADGSTRAGRVEGDDVVLLPFADVGDLLGSGDGWRDRAVDGERVPLAGASLVRLVPDPSKVLCIGRNYLSHIREGGADEVGPAFPELFTKFAESLTGPYDDIALPAGSGFTDFRDAIADEATSPTVSISSRSDCVDWEAELVVVVGKAVRRASPAQAEAAIAGFTVGNDVSVRDWQMHTSQWTQGKAWEATSPVGQVLVTADEVGVRPDLQIRCLVDGVVMQDFRTSDIVFGPVELVAYLSRIVTLRPGDMIFTGTGPGVGITRDPQVYLRPGQVMRTEMVGIAEAVNTLVADELGPDDGREARVAQSDQLVQDRT